MRLIKIKVSIILGLAMLFLMPVSWAADPIKGAKMYAKQCVRCHGADGRATFPGVPDFQKSNVFMNADKEIVAFIQSGSGMMPAFQSVFKEKEIYDLVAYLRKLSLH